MADNVHIQNFFFAPIEDRDDACRMVRVVSIAFVILAACQAALVALVFHTYTALVDTALYVIGALLVRQRHSRIGAIILLLTSGSMLVGACARAIERHRVGSGILLALAAVVAAGRLVEATFKIHSRFARQDDVKEPPTA